MSSELKHAFEIPRIVIAGASSNVGKTTVTAGLITALRQRGLVVQPFKCGPDYVDPSYHQKAAGRPCRNLDTWMLNDSQLLESFARACEDADIAVVEGVMGLYDGSDWQDERGSTAQIAKLLNAPVLLILDISGSARSAGAAALGFQKFDPAVQLCGVLLNFAGSERHAQGCAEAVLSATGLRMLGWLPRTLQMQIPERHLGLVPGGEQVDSDALIEQMGAAVGARFDVGGIEAVARAAAADVGRGGAGAAADGGGAADEQAIAFAVAGAAGAAGGVGPGAPDVPAGAPSAAAASMGARALAAGARATAADGPAPTSPAASRRLPRPTIAVARDEAFCFYYPENLELLIEEGAAVEFFSPLRGERPPDKVSGVYLGGGYPELHGPALASNTGLWSVLKDLHAADVPIYAECGGFMVLTQALIDADSHSWPMAGLLPGVAQMTNKLAALGYRYATALQSNLLTEAGDTVRGHEFRYSTWVHSAATDDSEAHSAWQVRATRGEAPLDAVGYARGNLLASYLHVHFGQNRALATSFVSRLK